jgi:hypothetical protein
VPDDEDELPEGAVADCELVQPAIATAPQMRKITTMNALALIPVDGRLLYLFVAIFGSVKSAVDCNFSLE